MKKWNKEHNLQAIGWRYGVWADQADVLRLGPIYQLAYPSLGKSSYAVFAIHDELLGGEASVVAQKIVGDCGYKVMVDPDGAHRIKPSTIDLIDSEIVSKEFHSNIK